MPPAIHLDQLIHTLKDHTLNDTEQNILQQGNVVLTGSEGNYAVWALVNAALPTVWDVLTAYEQFPDFLPSVVAARVLERRDNRVWVERRDRRKIGFLPIKVKIVTENIEFEQERIDYQMVEGTLDSMQGSWRLVPIPAPDNAPTTLLVQTIAATANMGPLQGYFYEVFETGLVETIADLRAEMTRRVEAPLQ
ncbi:MAG: hypothetical protein F6K42_17195 [Leptolyngbya sp. SIO1D8]|nr:hypothetical protein [Leptolyngbya sp. SIO1D8]